MNREEMAELAAVYALGALDGPDRERFEALLGSGDEDALAAVRQFEETLVALVGELQAPGPAHVRAAVLSRVAATPRVSGAPGLASGQERPRPRIRSRWTALLTGALAAGLAAVVAGLAVSAAYQQRLDKLLQEARVLREELRGQQAVVSLLRDPATQVVTLVGQSSSPDARARMMWNGAVGGLLLAEGLPPAPAGKTYQLWAITGDSPPVPAGLFAVDRGGAGTLRVPMLPGVSRVDVFAVTLEPEGGRPAPSGAMYLAGKAAG
jgi:anti-sigma-K factor RskA